MLNWLHHLLNPHCEYCREEKREAKVCSSCEVLREELAAARYNNQQLLRSILEPQVKQEIEVDKTEYKPVQSSLPWRVRQQLLETEDKAKKKLIDERKLQPVVSASVEELENELGVSNG